MTNSDRSSLTLKIRVLPCLLTGCLTLLGINVGLLAMFNSQVLRPLSKDVDKFHAQRRALRRDCQELESQRSEMKDHIDDLEKRRRWILDRLDGYRISKSEVQRTILKMAQAGDFMRACACVISVLETNPKYFEEFHANNYIVCYTPDMKPVIKRLSKLIDAHDSFDPGLYLLRAYYQAWYDDFSSKNPYSLESILADYQRVIDADPSNTIARALRARTYSRHGLFTEAEADFQCCAWQPGASALPSFFQAELALYKRSREEDEDEKQRLRREAFQHVERAMSLEPARRLCFVMGRGLYRDFSGSATEAELELIERVRTRGSD